jgi:hypothetical protein
VLLVLLVLVLVLLLLDVAGWRLLLPQRLE